MTSSDRVRLLCKDRRVPISKVERDLGYSNGYLATLKKDLPGDRLLDLAEYFHVSPRFLVSGSDETKKEPAASDGSKLSAEDIKFALFGGSDEITDEMYEEVKRFAAYVRARELERTGGAND